MTKNMMSHYIVVIMTTQAFRMKPYTEGNNFLLPSW